MAWRGAGSEWITAAPGSGCGAGSTVKYKAEHGRVTVEAHITAGGVNGGSLINGLMPVGYRPTGTGSQSHMFMTWGTSAFPVDVRSNGETYVWGSGQATDFQISYLTN